MKGLLKKKYADMTVGEMLKLSGGITLLSLVVMGIGTGVAYLWEQEQDKKWRQSLIKGKEEEIDD